jgi:hypothetical protein
MESKLKLYSLGVVVETKPNGTDLILVSPIEVLNIQEPGFIHEYQSRYQGNLPDVFDKGLDTELKSSDYIRAKWIAFGHSNRITAPDVVAGETVIIFRFGEVDEYYWTTIFREPSLRRQEDVVYAYSNLKNGTEEFDAKTSYWTQINTKKKFVHLHTANNDNEFTTYDVQIDTKNGRFVIYDGVGNYVNLDSKKGSIEINAINEIKIKAPTIALEGEVKNIGNITSSGSIIDTSGNTNHHSH